MNTQLRSITQIALFTALTAVCSQLLLPIPFMPVQISLATLAVMLSGALLGVKGAISQLIYLLIGLCGLPVFAGFLSGPSILVGPHGGFLIGYILCALTIGLLRRQLWLGMLLGTALLYLSGCLWFSYVTQSSATRTLSFCVLPFLPVDGLKMAVTVMVVRRMKAIQAFSSTAS